MNNIISLLTVCLMLAGTYLTEASKLFAGDGPVPEGVAPRPTAVSPANGSPGLAATLGIMFVEGSTSTVLVERDGRKYIVDLVARSVREAEP